ncbi:uncharacterized protein BO88DRAFT_84092 [Aspergillus vadensis CBS 113365]|uniref:Uncharacterized protein n=1 Tax=Aspergillus vadensis (strain CBS 113365 / IMI 142717 / IBT 24658) TaxID=1448311 RepID=A0A319B321_ASPVC|nr:hypothetical protein BO88DRAFT_84092 [Aspergillus vadensis CBS 113365]PYH67127.1 hypothetical protein BO88DRAFT_84092 [Aspergillus vadensis CBS 113365]
MRYHTLVINIFTFRTEREFSEQQATKQPVDGMQHTVTGWHQRLRSPACWFTRTCGSGRLDYCLTGNDSGTGHVAYSGEWRGCI